MPLRVLLFKVLANEARLKIVEALADGEKTVTELCNHTREEQTRVSHELRCLLVCGFVNFRREGRQIRYSLNTQTVLPILRAADSHVGKFVERMKSCDMLSEARSMKVHEVAV